MKRSIALLMLAGLLIMLFSACQSETPPAGGNAAAPAEAAPAETVTLTLWTHQEIPWNANDDKMIKAFEDKNPGIKVERESFPYDEFEQKTQVSLLSKSGGADIYKIWGGWALDFAKQGVFSAVPDSLIAELKNDCYEPVLGAFEYEGKYYGVPLEFNAEYGGMLVNKLWFDEHGVSYPQTWDEIITLATDNSVSNGGIFDMRGFDFVSYDTVPYTWLSMILSSGGKYLSDDGHSFDFDTPIAKETLQKLCDYVLINKVTNVDALTGGGEMEGFNWLFTNQALVVPRGMWCIPTGISDYEVEYGKEFEYIAMPFYGSEKKWAAETGWGLAVNAVGANTEAAWKYVSFCMEPENLVTINIECAMIPPRKTVAHDPSFVAALPYAKPILDVLDGASYVGYINTDVLKEAINSAFIDMVQNGTSADDAVKAINAAVNE